MGLVVGFVGVLVLAGEGDFGSNPGGMVFVMAAPIFWAIGSVWGSHLEFPGPAMATATQLLVGGAALAVLGPLRGERIPEMPPTSSWLALAYLIVFGSIVAYTAYVYLLRTVRPALATSYAYANPVVAVVLGVTLGAEVITGPALIALPLILAGVALAAAPSRIWSGAAWRRLRAHSSSGSSHGRLGQKGRGNADDTGTEPLPQAFGLRVASR